MMTLSVFGKENSGNLYANQPRRPARDSLPILFTCLLYPSIPSFEKVKGSLEIPKEFSAQSNLYARKVFSLFKLGHSF